MDIPDNYFLFLLIAANAMLLAAVAAVIIRFKHPRSRMQPEAPGPDGAPIAETESVTVGQQSLTDRQLERRLSELQSTLMSLAANVRTSSNLMKRSVPIDSAIRMAKSGASTDQLTRFCGLNVGEARLVKKMHCQAGLTAETTRD